MQAFVIYEDGALGSREQATSLADKTLGIAGRLGHIGATFIVLCDQIREAAMLGDLPQVEALGPQILDIGERGGLPWRFVGYIYLGLAAHWRDNAERAEEESCARPSRWSRRVRSAVRAVRCWRGTWHTRGAPRRFWSSSSRPGRVAQSRSGQRHRLVEWHARLR